MRSVFIIPTSVYLETDWSPAPFLNVGPVKIVSGKYSGMYAVSCSIFSSDPIYESYRGILEGLQVAEISIEELTPPEELTQLE